MIRFPKGLSKEHEGLYEACFAYCDNLVKEGQNIQDAVQAAVDKYGIILEDTEALRAFLLSEVTVYSEPSVAIVSDELTDRDWWSTLKDDSAFESEYWRRYEVYLRKKPSWGLKSVRDIDDSTDDVMNALVNPVRHPNEERMGLVFGYVQSGKTAHYLGLINKAYDAGYKIIIVLTGIHNSLRSQTQSRIDEEVLGYETSIESILNNEMKRNVIGVGIGRENAIKNRSLLQSVTTRDPYHVKMEQISRTTFIPVARGKGTEQWFYERARGQYLVELSRQPTPATKRQFKERCPKSRCISKTVAAKCVMAWLGYPDIVSKGLETNFVYFSEKIQSGELPKPSVKSYTEMIATVILFNTCDKIIMDMKFGGFKAQQDYYTIALIGKYFADRVDFQKIWNTQGLTEELIVLIPDLANFVWEHFQNPTVQGVNTGQWCKKEDCWTLLQERFEHSELYAKRGINVHCD